jgi:hypothetical protein
VTLVRRVASLLLDLPDGSTHVAHDVVLTTVLDSLEFESGQESRARGCPIDTVCCMMQAIAGHYTL